MPTYLEIAVNIPQVSGIFHYHLSEELEGRVGEGCLVSVPFGNQIVQGVVIQQVDQPAVAETRPVTSLIDPEAILTRKQIALAKWMSHETLSSLAVCIGLMLPPGLSKQADTVYELRSPGEPGLSLSPLQKKLTALLEKRGPLLGSQIDANFSRVEWRPSARKMVKLGLISATSVLPVPRVQPKFVRTARLACSPEKAEQAMLHLAAPLRQVRLSGDPDEVEKKLETCGRPGTAALERRKSLVKHLIISGSALYATDLCSVVGGTNSDLQKLEQAGLVEIMEVPSPTQLRRQAMLRFLIHEPESVEVSWLYAESGGNTEDLYALEERELIMLGETETFRDPLAGIDHLPNQPPPLTHDQQKAWGEIQELMAAAFRGEETPAVLLHGVTGSGKTEIYLQAVQKTLDCGKQAVILVPEIALTPQTVRRFLSRFPGKVGLIHSGLSTGERYDTWRRLRKGQLTVVVGPRSALFAPFPDLGLIVVDECHEDSYYQADVQPHYQARETAMAYALMAGAVCLLGSATPDIITYANATGEVSSRHPVKNRELVYIHLPDRILAHQEAIRKQLERLGSQLVRGSHFHLLEAQAETIELPPVRVVDMREELKQGNRSIFSRSLQTSLGDVLRNEQQAILFLNRRGSATYVFCRDCGLILKCPHCDLPLTFHQKESASTKPHLENQADSPKLVCHSCGYNRLFPRNCPECHGNHIRQLGIGTERVEADVQALFPGARTLRWDWETTRHKGSHEVILSHFLAHRADILVGTQMLAKGLDLPLVTLVGVVLADVGLGLPDYTANERTFQVLTQVAGRAGRSPLGGQVILQTFRPDHYVIQAAAKHDFRSFALQELGYRRELGYPPYVHLVRLEYRHSDFKQSEQTAKEMAARLDTWLKTEDRRATRLIGPYPPFFGKMGGLYRQQIILKGPDPASVLRQSERLKLLSDWHIEVNPPSLL